MSNQAFRALYGDVLADTVESLQASPDLQPALERERRSDQERVRAEAQVLKEICDAAENGVYGNEGQRIAERCLANGRGHSQQVSLRSALFAAGLLDRQGRKR